MPLKTNNTSVEIQSLAFQSLCGSIGPRRYQCRLSRILPTIAAFLVSSQVSYAASPGGLSSDLQLWLKADAGTSTSTDGNTLTTWSDQSSQGRNATETVHPPIFRDNATDNLNFNPSIEFNGSVNHLHLSLDSLEGTDGFTYFAVGVREDGNSNPILGSNEGRLAYYFGFYDDERFSFTINRSGTNPALSTIAAHDSPAISPYLGFGYNDSLQLERDSTTFAGSGNNTAMANHNTYYVGRSETNYYLGHISEVIIYDTTLGATDRSKILSYLAIKYGLTLGQNLAAQDYLSSSGTVIWDASTVGTTYDEDIAAIGQDDDSELDQTQSRSSNADAIVTIAENGSGMADGEFLFWSNDGGSNSFSTTDVPTGIDQRLTREWIIEETGEVGSVDISFDLDGITLPSGLSVPAEFLLLTDDDGTFASGTSTLEANSFSNNVVTFTGINENLLDDGGFFTLGVRDLEAPAGIDSGIQLWLKADAGTSTSTDGNTLTTWSDQSGQGRNATESTNPPIFRDNATDNLNFNPSIDFDGNDDHLDLSLDSLEGTDGFTYFAVGIREDGNSNPILGSNQDRLDYYFGFYDDERFSFTIDRSGTNPVLSTIAAHDSPAISPYLGFGYNDSLQLERDSTTFAGSGNNTSMANGSSYYVGRSESNYYLGRISEVIVYDTTLGATDRSKILSYLAIKYGLTLGQNVAAQDYLSSSGTVIWDASTVGTTYDEDISAIGQDDDSGLDQTQSKSSNADAIVTIAENGGGMADGEFLFWSNDGGSNSFSTTDVPTGIDQRLTREWVIEETGEVGSVDISFDLDGITLPSGVSAASHFFLLTDADGTFASGASTLASSSFSSNVVTFTGINEDLLDDGVFFTLGVGNENPNAADDSLTRVPGTDLVKIFVQDLLDNDSDPDGDSFSFVGNQLPATSTNGSTLSLLTGNRWILYTPAESAPATDDTFTYQIQDTIGATDTATVTLTTETPNTQTRNNTRAAVNGNDIDVEFRGIPGRKYKVQYTTSLEGTISWTDTGVTITAGSRGKLSHTDADAAAQHGSKFFRTVEVDE